MSTDLPRLFVDALNAEDTEAAAALLAEDVEVVFHQGTMRGREEWKRRRAGSDEPSQTQERVQDFSFEERDGAVELTGRYVVVWRESGELASEQRVRVHFELADGLISRLEFQPE